MYASVGATIVSMTTHAPAEILPGREAALSAGSKMIKQLTSWPPRITWAFGHAVSVELSDHLIEVEWIRPLDGLIGLRLRKTDDSQEYGVEMRLTPASIEDALQTIQPGMTLAAIGELKLSESSAEAAQTGPAGIIAPEGPVMSET
jgi:hypothetical protein